MPSFIKIDVEGFEYQVIRGLSRPVHTISLEFTPEFIESTFKCIVYLQRLGEVRLNYSLGETENMALGNWVRPAEMIQILSEFRGNYNVFGDVYAMFQVHGLR